MKIDRSRADRGAARRERREKSVGSAEKTPVFRAKKVDFWAVGKAEEQSREFH